MKARKLQGTVVNGKVQLDYWTHGKLMQHTSVPKCIGMQDFKASGSDLLFISL
jgi:hypothetical protein